MTDRAKSSQLGEDELQDLVASSDTGARQPANALVARIMIYVALVWSLFQLWYASPLPFTFGFFIVNDAEARAIHLGFAVFLGFMAFPALSKDPTGKVPVDRHDPGGAAAADVRSGCADRRGCGRTTCCSPLVLVLASGGADHCRRTSDLANPHFAGRLGDGAAGHLLRHLWLRELRRPGRPAGAADRNSTSWSRRPGLVLLLEATRRALGPPLMMVALIALCYVFFGDAAWVPDVVKYPGRLAEAAP